MRVAVATLLLLSAFQYITNLKVLPEQAKITFINTSHIEWGKVSVRRYSRGSSTYYLNIEGKILQSWGNNVTLHLLFYEFLHNEYRRSFVEMHFKFCDMITSDPYVGGLLKNAGLDECPLPPRDYHLMNMTVPSEEFPNVFPFQKGQIRVEIKAEDSKTYMIKGHITASFKDEKKKKKSKCLH